MKPYRVFFLGFFIVQVSVRDADRWTNIVKSPLKCNTVNIFFVELQIIGEQLYSCVVR